MLSEAERKRALRRTPEQAVDRLKQLVGHPIAGPAAETSLDLVATQGADPRMLAQVIDTALGGAFANDRTKP